MPKFWKREVEVKVAGRSVKSPPFDVDFIVNFDTDPEPNEGEVTIYNLTRDTVNRIVKDSSIIISAGYSGDTGTVFAGVVDYKEGYWDGPDRILKLEIGDATDKWAKATINKSYKAGSKASQIIPDALGLFGLEIGSFKLPNDVVYASGCTLSGSLQAEVRKIVTDCGAKFHISNGAIFINGPDDGKKTGFLLRHDTGLVGSPERIQGDEAEADYKVKSLLNYRIHADTLLQIQSETANGWFRVVSGRHKCNESDFYTEMEVVAL